ncbi:MAG: hydantoinase B/oxoprolinase family protein, partial [Stenotrophomonas maltophilia]
AGAEPGPACYGEGGTSATVTDANLVLGYLSAQNFLGGETRLDPELASQAIGQDVATPLGLSTVEAAYGVHQLVSTAIAEGIRLMSVKKGVDPREFTLFAFGGASGLQASRVARQLQMAKVYLPAAAPVLSAFGMLSTDLKYSFSRSYPATLDGIDLGAVRSILEELEAQGRERLGSQGLAAQDLDAHDLADESYQVARSADMRYLDQIYEVNIPLPDLAQNDDALIAEWAANFHRRYEELFSYRQVDQEIRLTTLRVETLGLLPRLDLPERDDSKSAASGEGENAGGLVPKEFRRAYLGGWQEVPVYGTESLIRGTEVKGPAILESDFTTILVEPGDLALMDQLGGIELQISFGVPTQREADGEEELDPITLAVVEHRLESIALEMTEVMLRTSMSQILNSSRDFSTAILDADCQLVAQGEGIPVHISALPLAAEAVRDYFGSAVGEGDVFILNDPYFGGSHLPDITIIEPIFYEGSLIFYAVNRAHHSDVGGGTHGGYNPAATEIYQEGLRIPPLRLYDRGVP